MSHLQSRRKEEEEEEDKDNSNVDTAIVSRSIGSTVGQQGGPLGLQAAIADKNADLPKRCMATPGTTSTNDKKKGISTTTTSTEAKEDGKEKGEEDEEATATAPAAATIYSPITIGEALEATAITAGNKPVDRSDAAAIQAAEVRATGRTNFIPGGLAATAQSAAQNNAKIQNDQDKTTLSDILTDAASKLPRDKPATRQDAEGVVSAELRNNPDISTHPTGVAASLVAAARLNQSAASAPRK